MFRTNLPETTVRVVSLLLFGLAVMLSHAAQAQTFSVIHTFTGPDGMWPQAGLTIDARGRLYGTASSGGQNDHGSVFRVAPQGSGWVTTPLFKFGGSVGSAPIARPLFAPNGLLYGTTNSGGAGNCEGLGCGTVYSLRPGPNACTSALCPWLEHVVFSFGGLLAICDVSQPSEAGGARNPQRLPEENIGVCPGFGDLTFDQAGNVYGAITCCDGGAVYQLTARGANALYYFSGGADGGDPESGVIFDSAGNLYGTTAGGGSVNCGTVYELSPNGSGWTEKVLYSFQCGADGESPVGGLIFDASGNLYGTTSFGGAGKGGTVFELTPSGSNWTFQVLYSLNYSGTQDYLTGPSGILAMDAAGNLYGTAVLAGAFSAGSVFKLTPSNGSWIYTSLYDFSGGTDGGDPYGNVVFDGTGNIYGTAEVGGLNSCFPGLGCGTVWGITP